MSKEGNVHAKALELYKGDKVRRLDDLTCYKVEGYTGDYLVIIQLKDKNFIPVFCDCQATSYCSHMGAAYIAASREQNDDPFEGLV